MTKKIYYSELLELIHQHKQPTYLWYNHKKFIWLVDNYYTEEENTSDTLLWERLSNVYGLDDIKKGNSDISIDLLATILPKFKVEIELDKLDDSERRYLRSVINPFRYKVEYIVKHYISRFDSSDFKECISIGIIGKNELTLPEFEIGEMYQGMELNKYYTIKELGL